MYFCSTTKDLAINSKRIGTFKHFVMLPLYNKPRVAL